MREGAWGRQRKVATRSKLGVNTAPLKKPAADGLKLKFKRIDKATDCWVNIPRKPKEGQPPRSKGNPILRADMSDEGGPCFATFKEKQNLEKYGKSEKE
jgi:hypothetical protein